LAAIIEIYSFWLSSRPQLANQAFTPPWEEPHILRNAFDYTEIVTFFSYLVLGTGRVMQAGRYVQSVEPRAYGTPSAHHLRAQEAGFEVKYSRKVFGEEFGKPRDHLQCITISYI